MLAHIPVLVVALPLLCAPLCLLLRDTKYLYGLSLLVSTFSVAACAWMLIYTHNTGTIPYHLGGWMPPFGIAYLVDTLNALVAFLLSIIFLFVFLYIPKSFAVELKDRHHYPIYSALFIAQSGFTGVVVTDDLFNVYVFLEMASLAAYGLTAAKGKVTDLTAAYQYLIMGTLGAIFLLLGIGYLYILSGTLNLSDLSVRLPALLDSRAGLAALVFIIIGLFLKSALFPLHFWLPRVYTYTPSAISALFSAISSKVSLYLLIRFYFDIFSGSSFSAQLGNILLLLGSLSILFASFVACRQTHIKRMMAYSSIAQLGYIVVAIGLLSSAGIAAALIHLFNHAIIKCMLFLVLGCVVYKMGNCTLVELRGLAKQMPWTMGALVIGGLGLIGVPLTSGFISKWYLIAAALQANAWPIVVVVLTGSVLSLIYVWRLIGTAYFEEGKTTAAKAASPSMNAVVKEVPLSMHIAVYALVAITLYTGVQPAWLTDICLAIGNSLWQQ